MSRRNTLILVIAALLLTGFSAALSRRDSRDWRANRSRRLLPFPWQDAVAVTLAKPDGTRLEFKKGESGEWRILLGDELADTLNPSAVEELTALASLAWREAQKERQAPAPGAASVMTVASAAGQKVELAFGDVRNNLRATVVDGDAAAIYGVNQDLLGFLDWPPERFRNLYLASVGGGRKPRKIVLSPSTPDGSGSLAVTLEQGQSGWRITAPVSWPVDETRLDAVIRWLDRLRGESIEAEMTGDLEWFGFDSGSATVEAWYDGPAGEIRRRIEFGKPTDDGRIYARAVGRDPIFAVRRTVLDEIDFNLAADNPAAWLNFYRLRHLNAVGDQTLASVTVERLLPEPAKLSVTQRVDKGAIHWEGSLEDAAGVRVFPLDPPDINDRMRPLTALFTGLSNLNAVDFLADSAPGPETNKWTAHPAWRISVAGSGNPTPHVLTLYAADAAGALAPGAPYVEGEAGPRDLASDADAAALPAIPFSLSGYDAVMEMPGDMAYLLCLPPYRYRSARMIALEPRSWRRVTVANPDGEAAYFRKPDEVNEQWWREGAPPEPLMDDNNRFVETILLLSQLKSEGFVADAGGDEAEFGLDRPEITAIVYSSPEGPADADGGEPLFTLAVGKEADADGRRYARLNDGGPVFLISPRVAQALEATYR